MFYDKVFSVPELTPENIFHLDIICPSCNQLVVPQKREKANTYVLRRCEPTLNSYEISNDPLPNYTIRYNLKKCGEIAGFKHPVIPRNL